MKRDEEGWRRLKRVGEGCRRLEKVGEGWRRLKRDGEGRRRSEKVRESSDFLMELLLLEESLRRSGIFPGFPGPPGVRSQKVLRKLLESEGWRRLEKVGESWRKLEKS